MDTTLKLHTAIVDDFFPSFDALRAYADLADFDDVRNPADGVIYPGICSDIPGNIRSEVAESLEKIISSPVTLGYLFMRLSLEGIVVPHQAHTDATMGEYSLMLYLNRAEHCTGGTSLVRHLETGMQENPVTDEQVAVWQSDTNIPEAWEIVSLAEMKPNRAFIFKAELFHRAEPIGGFGHDTRNGRLVLTAFFNT